MVAAAIAAEHRRRGRRTSDRRRGRARAATPCAAHQPDRREPRRPALAASGRLADAARVRDGRGDQRGDRDGSAVPGDLPGGRAAGGARRAAARAQAGEQIRMLSELPTRLIVIGTTHAVVPEPLGYADEPRLLVRQGALVESLILLFEQLWSRAAPVPDARPRRGAAGPAQVPPAAARGRPEGRADRPQPRHEPAHGPPPHRRPDDRARRRLAVRRPASRPCGAAGSSGHPSPVGCAPLGKGMQVPSAVGAITLKLPSMNLGSAAWVGLPAGGVVAQVDDGDLLAARRPARGAVPTRGLAGTAPRCSVGDSTRSGGTSADVACLAGPGSGPHRARVVRRRRVAPVTDAPAGARIQGSTIEYAAGSSRQVRCRSGPLISPSAAQ